jgi:hypothetical protein
VNREMFVIIQKTTVIETFNIKPKETGEQKRAKKVKREKK